MLAGCQPKTETAGLDPVESAYFLASDHRISIDGMNVRYRDQGPKSAPVIVMVHGFTSSLETWDALADELDDRYRILRPDLPGHGLTGPGSRRTFTTMKTQ